MSSVCGNTAQVLGEEREEGVVFSVSLKRVHYQPSDHRHTNGGGHLQWNTQKVKTIRAATVEKLVEHLAPSSEQINVTYRTCFLCTFRTFTTVENVLQLLKERYLSMMPTPGDSTKECNDMMNVQNAITSFLRLWLDRYPMDFYSPPSHHLLSLLHPFTPHSPELTRVTEGVSRNFESSQSSPQGPSPNGSPISGRHKIFDLFTLTPIEFAHCLTTEDAEVFQRIIPHECLDYVRRPKEVNNAPTVRACIEQFNRVSLVVVSTILGGLEAELRGYIIGTWITIAQDCRAVKNFSSLKAIICGLLSTAVFRLRKSWATVPSGKISLFQELSELVAADDNHQMSRDLLNREGTAKYAEISTKTKGKNHLNGVRGSVQGVVPYLGTFLTDLTMLHSAYDDKTHEGLVNFEKHRKEFELLAQLTLYQKSAGNYCFPTHSGLTHWLASLHTLTQKDSYQLSKQLEPEDSPPSQNMPELTLPPLSPSRFKRTIKYIFNPKGTAVSDIGSLSSPKSKLSPSISLSERDVSLVGHECEDGRRNSRAMSLSPQVVRRSVSEPATTGHVIRIAITNSDSCNYKSLVITETDKAGSVIKKAVHKHGLKDPPSEYILVQLLKDNKRVEIPENGNVFYALSNNTEGFVTLLLDKKCSDAVKS